MKKVILSIFLLALMAASATAQDSTNIRKGWTFGVLPSFAYDADLGLQLGALTNVYYFGDGKIYPGYYHSFYAEAAYTTKHYGLFRLSYDSKYLIPGHRLSIDLTYLPDQMCDFYGFNGYATHYNPGYADPSSPHYLTRAYYKMKRDMFRFSADLQGTIAKPWYWNVGAGLLYYNYGSVDVDRLNKFAKDDPLPNEPTLFDEYVRLGYITQPGIHLLTDLPPFSAQGYHPYLHGGLTFDTRDRQQNPRRGIHADAFLTYYAGLGDMSDYNCLKFNAAWRHYLPIIQNRLTFAYRLGTQLNVAGNSPFYLNTYLNQLYMQRVIYEGLGGANSIRGIMRNRILAEGVAFANVEFRVQVAHFRIGKENFYIGLNPFMDAGMVVQPYDKVVSDPHQVILAATTDGIIYDYEAYYDESNLYTPHLSAGCGLKVAMNDNFVLSVDWATALDKQDNGKFSNLYIKMGYMF